MLNIPVILGSTRNGRKSIGPANFLVEKLREAGCETQLVDFQVLPLPFMDSELVPSKLAGKYPYPNVQTWSGIAEAADAFVFVTPEYNHSYPAVLKNALDWLYPEFNHKSVGLVGVSNGKIGAGRAMEHLRPVIENFGMFAIKETVPIGPVQDAFDESGKLIQESYLKQIDGLIKSLMWSADAMKAARHSLLNTKVN